MDERKSFLLRIDAKVLDDVRRWADDDLRSLNGQIEFLLVVLCSERSAQPIVSAGRLCGGLPGPRPGPLAVSACCGVSTV